MTSTSPPPSGAEKARLLRRAQAVARIRHPNLARLLPLPGGAGLQPILGDAHKLSDFTLPAGTFKRFELEQVVRLLLDVLAGLGALHEVVTDGQAFVHGEVCPSNVYVDEHGTARLIPLLNVHSAPLLPQYSGYAAPERLLGSLLDARVDTFSVGAMLWEALSGARLFPDPSPAAVLSRQIPPIQLNPRLAWAKPLCAIAERAISFEPKARFQTAHELAEAIASAASSRLSLLNDEAWQEEAPTPVFQPRLHLASLRASTPPPAVLDTHERSVNEAPDTVSPIVSTDEQDVEEPRRSGRGGRVAMGLAALALGAVALGWQHGPRSLYERSFSHSAAPPFAAARTAEPPALPLPTAPATVASSSAPTPSVSPPLSASATVLPLGKPQRASTPAARPKLSSKSADYGI